MGQLVLSHETVKPVVWQRLVFAGSAALLRHEQLGVSCVKQPVAPEEADGIRRVPGGPALVAPSKSSALFASIPASAVYLLGVRRSVAVCLIAAAKRHESLFASLDISRAKC